MKTNIAVILAGGVGSRFGKDYPKQFAKVAGKTLLQHTIDVFQLNGQIDEVVIVSKANFVDTIWNLVNKGGCSKVSSVIPGGVDRMGSTQNALDFIHKNYKQHEAINLIIHDAVRPFVTENTIRDCLDALEKFNAVDVVINSADTIVEVDSSGILKDIPDRSSLRRGQTPQCFAFMTLYDAYEKAKTYDGLKVTCDCGVLMQVSPEIKIATVMGDNTNIKITEPIDISIADHVFQQRGDAKISFMKEKELCETMDGKVVVIFGGSYGIGQDIASMAENFGADIFCFSRGVTNTDVSNINDVEYALNSVYQKKGRIDFVVNTAALLKKKPLSHMDDNEIKNIIDVNLFGAIIVAKKSLPFLKKVQGSLLNFTSSSYTRGRAFYSSYSASKAAVVNLTQALSEEWVDFNVSVNCINPERTATPMRVSNFGHEAPDSLLKSADVALASINTMASGGSGHVVSVRFDNVGERNEYFKE
ncbi:bifunctional cytidylyltransferase/SDR family oxidoreductase [uncultured Microbulbifer sp.]|uniref:bifunctional cytidylyltransferase/SDR family oxidoreductase n=1 Tax=uncultured Microbulbifer sp. TaxID=348147 RepID=UPI00262CF539|nr:bifunctional cytidylyltransferase/SDR family oxidoreductase [uncultured Microbulbifer sp.]